MSSELLDNTMNGVPVFSALYQLYARRVFALCFRMTRNVVDAEDLTQEVFLAVYQKLDTFRGESAFSSWLYRVTANIVLMHHRKRRLTTLNIDEVLPAEHDMDFRSAPANACCSTNPLNRIALARALSKLPDRSRTVVLLHDIRGLTHSEVATRLGIGVRTSKSRLHKAHRSLRDLIDGADSIREAKAQPSFSRRVVSEGHTDFK